MELNVELKGVKEVEEVLEEAGSLRPFKSGLKAGAFYLKGKFAVYPPVNRRSQPFVSDKQRRGFFYHLKQGNIEVPYRRGMSPGSEKHGQSWTVQDRQGGLQQVIGSDTSYGPLLQDQGRQTGYHKAGGWKTVQETVKVELKNVIAIINKAIDQAIKRMNK